jgi:hypothetical protein
LKSSEPQSGIVEQLMGEIQCLREQLNNLNERPQTHIRTQNINTDMSSTNSNNNNTIIIVPPAFLERDKYDNIMKEMPRLLHEALSKHPANFVSYLVERTNCNPSVPMYNSIRVTNKKSPFVMVSNGKKFVYASRKDVIEQLIENKRYILQQYVDENGHQYGNTILKRYQDYLDVLDDERGKSQKELEVNISCMLLNISDVIGSDEWSKKLLEDLKDLKDLEE